VEFLGEGFAEGGEAFVFGFFEEGVGELADGEEVVAAAGVEESEVEGDGGVAGELAAGGKKCAEGGGMVAGGGEGGGEGDQGGVEVILGEAVGDGFAEEGDGGGVVAGGGEGEGVVEGGGHVGIVVGKGEVERVKFKG